MMNITRRWRELLPMLALLIFTSFSARAQDSLQPWQNFDFSKNAIKTAQIQGLELWDLKLLRGIVFGHHGRVFKDSDIKSYLESQSWYKANPDFTNSLL